MTEVCGSGGGGVFDQGGGREKVGVSDGTFEADVVGAGSS